MLTNKEPITPEDYRNIQACLLNILKAIHEVCTEHNLRYYIIAGTMLGAVRHKGFIPWDDDADIAMPRKDYETLIAHADEWLPERYELVDSKRNKKYPYHFVRIQDKATTYILRRSFDFTGGVPVDVFPLDGMTTNKLKCRWHYLRYWTLDKLLYFSLANPKKHGYGIRYLFATIIHKLLPIAKAHRIINTVQKEYDYEKSPLTADHDNGMKRGILPKEVYGKPELIDFEGTQLYGVARPDTYLRHCYGDYMTPPRQTPPLNFRLIDLDKPYHTYLKERG